MKTQNLSKEDLLLLHLQADLSVNMLFSYATGFFGSDFPRIVRIHEKLVNRCLRRRKLLQSFEDSAWFANPSPDFAVLENVAVEVTQGATYSQALCVHCIEQGHDNVLIDVQAFTSLYPQCVGCVYQGVPVQLTHSFVVQEFIEAQALVFEACALQKRICDAVRIHKYSDKSMRLMERGDRRVMRRSRFLTSLCKESAVVDLEDEYIDEVDFIDAGISPARVPVQLTDSFFDLLPLSAYLDDMPTPPCSGVISWSLYEIVGG